MLSMQDPGKMPLDAIRRARDTPLSFAQVLMAQQVPVVLYCLQRWDRGSTLTEERVQRRLAAIFAADVVGYSAMMERAEAATYAEIGRLRRDIIDPHLTRHQGRLIKTMGDGI